MKKAKGQSSRNAASERYTLQEKAAGEGFVLEGPIHIQSQLPLGPNEASKTIHPVGGAFEMVDNTQAVYEIERHGCERRPQEIRLDEIG
jgi:hypothetical protein